MIINLFILTNTNIDFAREANRFLDNGYFNSLLGDLMPLPIATALKVTIFILSKNLQSPPLFIIPLCGQPIGMIFLVYNPAAAGHYDAAIPYSCTVTQNKPQDSLRKESRVSCSCGVNKKIDQKSCAPNLIYATRCKCFAQCKPCSSSCCCKNCSNPFGTQPEKPIGAK